MKTSEGERAVDRLIVLSSVSVSRKKCWFPMSRGMAKLCQKSTDQPES